MTKAPEIVITGGPCAGKTTGLNFLLEKLADLGIMPFLAPEVATIIINSGLGNINEIARLSPDKILKIEEVMFLTQLSLRKRYNELAEIFSENKRVIIYDHGLMDIMAYTGPDYFNFLLKKYGLDIIRARDYYDGVIHLTTAAVGAEKFYTIANNKARRETLEEAKAADEKTLSAWIGHPHLKVINNSTDFEKKLKRLFQTICVMLGIPAPIEIEKKFLVKKFPDLRELSQSNVQKIFIEQMYLISDDSSKEIRIRKRSQNGASAYYQTVKERIDDISRHETEIMISDKEYDNLALSRDPKKKIIIKERYCFVYRDQYFELDKFINPPGLILLEIKLTDRNEKIEIPKFLKGLREVTNDRRFTNFEIASK
jgi:CYTH domain-containing protein/predicted ATPase